jgi:hypothetical protein
MRKSVKFFMLALVAVIGAAFTSTAANAASISASPAGGVTATSLGRVALAGTGGFIDITLNCNVTLSGSLNSSINNANGATVGSITAGSASNCDNGTADVLASSTNSWALTLNGTPNLTTLTAGLIVNNAQFSVTVLGNVCLYAGNVPASLGYSGTGPYTTGLITIQRHSLPLSSGGFLCPDSGELTGTFGFTRQTLTLVP